MAEAEAEATFFGASQAMNESSGNYNIKSGTSGQQIDSSSSDEYDPAQDVQDIPLSSGPQNLSNHDISLDYSNNDAMRLRSTTSPSLIPPTGTSTLTSFANNESAIQPKLSVDPTNYPVTYETTQNHSNLADGGDTPLRDSNPEALPIPSSDEIMQTPLIVIPNTPAILTQISAATSAPSSAAPKARLPHDKIGILEDRIKEDERGDMEAWLSLIDEHKSRGKLDEARKVYDRLFSVFPSAAEQRVAYIQLEIEAHNREAVEAIFNKTLKSVPSLQLWSAYLDHIRRYYNIATDKTGTASQITHAAYEAVLDAVGIDKEAGKLWQDYIQFIKSGPGVIGGSNWQDQQKMDLLRKAYQRAICIPTQAIEGLWKEYTVFEASLNKTTGRKFLLEQSPAYMTARACYMELQGITRELRRTTISVLPPALGFEGDIEFMKQVDLWKRWIEWEKKDSLVLKEEDLVTYKARIVYVYRQALMAMQFWPELWFDAAEFCFDNNLESEGNDFLAEGISANPESCLLALKRADRLELSTTNGNDDESKKRRGDMVREPYDKLLDALYELIAKAMAREARDITRIEAEFMETDTDHQSNNKASDDDQDNKNDDHMREVAQKKKTQIDAVKNMNAVQVRLLHKTLSHAWIALMRSMHRMQGKGKVGGFIGGSRQAFIDARKRGRLTSDVWIAAAMLEFHSSEGESTKKIFERGLKLFPDDEYFALEYIKHLFATNDYTNARVVFETAVSRLSQKPENLIKAKPLYTYFHSFESRYGELGQIINLEKRMRTSFPNDPRLAVFSQRFVHEGFDPTAIRPIVSPAIQARPKKAATAEYPQPAPESPPNRFIKVASPKRPLPFEELDDEASRPRKLARGESPLKGAAGRRLDQQKRNQQPHMGTHFEGQSNSQLPPQPLPREISFLLAIIPGASTYHATKFKPEEMVRLIRDTHIPSNASQLRLPPPTPQPPAMNGLGTQHLSPMPPVASTLYGG